METTTIEDSIIRSKKLCDDLFNEYSKFYLGARVSLVREVLTVALSLVDNIYAVRTEQFDQLKGN